MANTPNINNNRKSVNLLPTFFRTNKNTKFLSSTIDQLINIPALERIDGFVGSKLTPTYDPLTDLYIPDVLPLRQSYQLEPALIIKEKDGITFKKAFGYDDLINQINYFGGHVDNLNRLFRPKFYSYDPHIDLDKFINFREYYWLPTGPDIISISGLQKNTVSTYTVTDSKDGFFFVFSPDGLTEVPLVTLYRGVTYVFNVNSNHKLYFKTADLPGTEGEYTHGITGNGTNNGQIIFTIDSATPSVLFYNASDNQLNGGRILVKTITEDSVLDVEKEILGKSQYKSSSGVEFINGLKIKFIGDVTPSSYASGEYIVEGVGTKIKLIRFDTLVNPENLGTIYDENFDSTPFDTFPFDNFKNIPLTAEYITINKASLDLNPWTRYNRWFHSDVIRTVAQANNTVPVFPANFRAARPIIEFQANLQLQNFGNRSVISVDLIDEITTDAFSSVERSPGYHVDGVLLQEGNTVIFNADPDPIVAGKIYEVHFVIIEGKSQVELLEILSPQVGAATIINLGNTRQGTEWWFDGTKWVYGQQRTALNQMPLFDLFDRDGHSYNNKNYYNSEFLGNKVFGYGIGTGEPDPILGFPLKYVDENEQLVGTYLFDNYLNLDTITLIEGNTTTTVPTYKAYLRDNTDLNNFVYYNSWNISNRNYDIPVLQFQVINTITSTIEVTVFDNPANITDLIVEVFINNVKKTEITDYVIRSNNTKLYIDFVNPLNGTTDPIMVLFKFYTIKSPINNGAYEVPINLTNNPLNSQLTGEFTLSELSDHVKSMIDRNPNFSGVYPGISNLSSLPNITSYGTRMIGNQNPLSFAHLFITDKEHNMIDAIRAAGNDYYQFKLNLIKFITQIKGQKSSADILDEALLAINQNKNLNFPYSSSDMLGYSTNHIISTYTVTDIRNINYSISSVFNLNELSNRSVLIYYTDIDTSETVQLIAMRDYIFEQYSSSVQIISRIKKGDKIIIKDYISTIGSYIPPTPSKLGLYPKYEPSIFVDDSYIDGPKKVIQGHDGSITIAFSEYNEPDDYRDLAVLEYESRVFNNIKTTYDSDLINIDDILPSVFGTRKHLGGTTPFNFEISEYSFSEINNIIQGDFLKWASVFGADPFTNSTYDLNNHKTYNFSSATDYTFNDIIPGSWRGIYDYYFGTDRPNTHPWEMLGFYIKPTWWEAEYGPAPYTSGNLTLWQDLEEGRIRQGSRQGIDSTYVREGLQSVIPVDESGNIIDVREWAGMAQNDSIPNTDQNWKFGDLGPTETAWRHSSLWPFMVQIILALTKPSDYAAFMFDTSRLKKDITGQYNYGPNEEFLNLKTVSLCSDIDSDGNMILASGYGCWVIEHGKQRIPNYLTILKQDIQNINFNLFYKAGGFLSKDKLEMQIDSVSPDTTNPGVLLPNQDYNVFFNVSNPIKSVAISGIIIEKGEGQFIVRGYDKHYPYFIINKPIPQVSSSSVTVGGKSESFLEWTENSFYQAGQIVRYNNSYYRVINSHNSGTAFVAINYAPLKSVPIVGGASVISFAQFDSDETIVPYGTRYTTLQEVYDFIVGYGNWLKGQGFIFNEYNQDLSQILDWKFSGKEFLFWTTQNWEIGTVITLSPFSNSLKYQFIESVVDDILNRFYEYSLLKADGQSFPVKNFSVSRVDGACTITTVNTFEGLFFARLNLVQKEHSLIFNNVSIFNDIIYDIETGYRQARIKLSGFRTAKWNGEFLSPGFIFDAAQVSDWAAYVNYQTTDIVKYVGNYYSANTKIIGSTTFDFTEWTLLGSNSTGSVPITQLLPNFEYKIGQFEDFYSLDIDNFDSGQQKMAQHLIGYTPRTYLDNIFVNPIAQYKFYQGFIREKGTRNAIDKLSKASVHNLQGQIKYNEEWAFRIGVYGNYTSYNEIEFPLRETDFKENSQIIRFVDAVPTQSNDAISYILPADLTIKNDTYVSSHVFSTESETEDSPKFNIL